MSRLNLSSHVQSWKELSYCAFARALKHKLLLTDADVLFVFLLFFYRIVNVRPFSVFL